MKEDFDGWSTISENNIYIKGDEQFNKYKDLYLLQQAYDSDYLDSVIVISAPTIEIPKVVSMMAPGPQKAKAMADYNRLVARQKAKFACFQSSPHVKSYDDIEVSDEWLEDYKKEAAAAEKVAQFENITAAERRKIEERMVAFTLREDSRRNDDKKYTWDKIEPKAKELMQSEKTIYYGSTVDEAKFMIAADIIGCYAPTFDQVFPENTWYSWNECKQGKMFYYEQPPVRVYSTYGEDKGQPVEWARPGKMQDQWDTPQLIRVRETYIKHIKKNLTVNTLMSFSYN